MLSRRAENYLDKVPSRSEDFDWEVDEHQEVTILIENTGFFNWIGQTLLNKPKVSEVQMEEFGSFIWLQMNGQRSVNDIAQLMQEEFGKRADPLYDRLIAYMHTLENHGFVKF